MTTKSISTTEASTGPVSGSSAFQSEQVFTIAGGHFIHDSFSAFLAPVLPLIQERLAIGYAGAGGLAVFTQIPSMLTPFIGYLADKVSVRYFVILAPAASASLMCAMGLAPDYFSLALLLLAVGISTAAFHAPAPAMIARVAGGRVGTGMSIFMASGELGRTIGPIVVVAGVTWWGLEGLWRLAVIGWLTSIVLYWRLHSVTAQPSNGLQAPLRQIWPQIRAVFSVLIWIMIAKAFMMAALTTYLPLFMRNELQVSLWLAAASLTILEAAGVVGALFTGTASDWFGRQRVLFVLLSVAPLLLLLFLFGPGWLAVPLLLALGLTALSPTPVMLAIVQDQFPDHRATANGIFMFANFVARALAIWVIGVLGDQIGLANAFAAGSILAFVGVPAVAFLPKQKADDDLE